MTEPPSRRVLVNPGARPDRVPPPAGPAATWFHRRLPGYAPTPVRSLPDAAAALGLGAVLVKDESDRLGLPAFKILRTPDGQALRDAVGLGPGSRVLFVATEGPTDPASYRAAVASAVA